MTYSIEKSLVQGLPYPLCTYVYSLTYSLTVNIMSWGLGLLFQIVGKVHGEQAMSFSFFQV